MKRWFETRTLDFPTCTVSGRFGASVMFVGYERWAKQWLWLQPGGVVERIAEPTHIFVDEEWAREHTLKQPRAKIESVKIRRGKKAAQLVLDL